MRRKSHQGKYSLILLFVGIFAFWWGIAVLAQNDKSASLGTSVSPVAQAAPAPSVDNDTFESISNPIAIQETVKGNVYTYSGSIMLPNPCDNVGTGISVNGFNPEHITIFLTLTKSLTGCTDQPQTFTAQPFGVSLTIATGTKAILDGLTVNGIIAATHLTKASAQ